MKKLYFLLLASVMTSGVLPLLAQPVINQSPANQLVASGGTITLTVTASGAAPAFQWFKDGNLISDATNSLYAITNAGVIHSGLYRVLVTNAGGMVISLPARVTVANSSLLAWGNNGGGQLGNGTYSDSAVPMRIADSVVAMAGGGSYTLYVGSNGSLWGMGLNIYGQLGIGSNISTNLPVLVTSNVLCVAAGQYHSLFVSTNGRLSAMGWNYYGQLGNGSNVDSSLPVVVASNVVSVVVGANHSLFIKTDGTLWAFGANYFGQLGNGTLNSTNLPILVASNVVSAAAGYGHSLFVKADKTLWAMGYNYFGQLGNGTLIDTNRPVLVATNVTAVASGYGHSLYVTQGQFLWAMGDNLKGQLGNGNVVSTNPVPIFVASNVLTAAGGNSHSLFVKKDGTLWAMGENSYGQLGDGSTTNSAVPVMLPSSLMTGCLYQGALAQHSLASGLVYSNATVVLSNLYQLYTGSAVDAVATTVPGGLNVNLTYNGLAAAPTNAGSYVVVATISDPIYRGSTTNSLVIGLPPQSFMAALTNNNQGVTLKLTGTPYYPYFLQVATNLTPPVNWQSIFTNFADVNGNWVWTMTNLTDLPQSFYRTGAF